MIDTLKSEFRKLLTVRSTYLITFLALLLFGFISFWVLGYRMRGETGSDFLSNNIYDIVPVAALFSGLVAILLMGHEYRYNLIVYTLTASKSRTMVLLSKMIVTSVYAFFLTLIIVAFMIFLPMIGHTLAGLSLPPQDINFVEVFGKVVFYSIAFSLAGLLFATLIRNLIFAIVFILIVPNTVETLATLIFKENAIYLPFSALSQVVIPPGRNVPTEQGPFQVGQLSPIEGALVFSAYLIVGWLITWYIFLRRDAT